jgi:hypothetical protein
LKSDAAQHLLRPSSSSLYPWYDSVWLEAYTKARAVVRKVKPEALDEFQDAFRVFHTRPDFKVKSFSHIFDDNTMGKIRDAVSSLKPTDFEFHEVRQFKRFVVHNHGFFTELQEQLVLLVSEAAGELVESSYNFLSLYGAMGICPLHMDAPEAKWTLDLCLGQSEPWPLHISQVQPWPDVDPELEEQTSSNDNWEEAIKQSPALNFSAYTMKPDQAILFSGSSQWHYRNAMPNVNSRSFCDLLFFHFMPLGTKALVQPENWARLFDIPELAVG